MAGWDKIITFDKMTLRSGLNGADIGDHECQEAIDVIFDNNVLETAPGRTLLGPALPTGYPVDGVCRSWNKEGDKTLIRAVNGAIQRWNGATWENVTTGLKADVPYDFINAEDKTAIVNGYDDARIFDPVGNTIKKLGLEPPIFYKKVCYFEDDEESLWSLGTSHAFNNNIYRIEERTGTSRQSLYVTAPVGSPKTSTLTYASSQNFSVFPNAISVSNDSTFNISVFHKVRSYVSSITIQFITSTNNYYELVISGSELDPLLLRDNVWTNVVAKRSRFVVGLGTPDWTTITQFSITLTAQTGTSEIYVDNCYWKNPVIEATGYRKQIDNFEGQISDWSVTNGTIADEISETKRVEGSKSLKVTRSASPTTVTKTVSVNLSQYIDGISSQDSDEIAFHVYIPSSANLTSIKLELYSELSPTPRYFHYTWTTFATSASPVMNNLRKAKSSFTSVSSPSWAAIIHYKLIITTTGSLDLYFDNLLLEEPVVTKQLATMETTESWSFPGEGHSGFNSEVSHKVEGLTSIYVVPPYNNFKYATLMSAANLTELSTGVGSGDTDTISFWVKIVGFQLFEYLELQVDINASDFSTDYYYCQFTAADIMTLVGDPELSSGYWAVVGAKTTSLRIDIKKQDFTRVGTTGGKDWSTAKGYRFKVKATGNLYWPLMVYFDDLVLTRRTGLRGIYQWCCVFKSADGTKSAPSEWSPQVTFLGTKALLGLLPISADTDVIERHFYRKGGTVGSIAKLDFVLYDNTTTSYYTSSQDSLLGETLDPNEIPNGTIRVPYGAKWGPKFKGEYILYRDPSNLRRVYYSISNHIYGWSEQRAYDFESDVLDVFVIDNILFFNTKTGILSLSVALSEASPSLFHERGMVKHSVGPFASCQVEGNRLIVSYDGVYLFNGYTATYLSDSVKNYFDPSVYNISEAIVFYRKHHAYIAVVTTTGVRSFLDYYFEKQAWRKSNEIVNCFCVAEGIGDNQEIYMGDRSGNVYQFDDGYASAFEFWTKDYSVNPDPFTEVVLSEIYVMARSDSVNPGAISVRFRTNQQNKFTKTLPASGSVDSLYKTYHAQLRGVEEYLKGNRIGLIITPTDADKHYAIKAIKLMGETAPLPEIYESGGTEFELLNGTVLQLTTGESLELAEIV